MNCCFCSESEEGETLEIVPVPPSQVDLTKSAFAHIRCLREKGLYCVKHEKVHGSFTNGTACYDCIQETAEGLIPFADGIIDRLKDRLDPEKWESLEDWAEMSSEIIRWPFQHAMMFAVATSFQVLRSQRQDSPEGQLTNDNFSERLEFVLEAIKQTSDAIVFPF